MDRDSDREVLRAAIDWLEEGDVIYLVTVAKTWGSSPRQAGALMVIHSDGRFCGSVSGGCVEDDLVQRVLKGEFEHHTPLLTEYGARANGTQRISLPCGGQLTLLVETIDSTSQLRKLLKTIDERRQITRRVCLNTGESSLHPTTTDSDFSFDDDNLVKVFGPRWRLLLIGAGELSRRVAQLALTLDYAVTVCDSRPEYACTWQLQGTEFVNRAAEQVVREFNPDQHTVVLALSHSPSLDDGALLAALNSEAFYVGALGSMRNQQARLKRLQQRGLSQVQLARLHGPVGLTIGSRTPAEIAVAIMAELIAERHALGQTLTNEHQALEHAQA